MTSCWCVRLDDRTCDCGGLLMVLGEHCLNCPQHPFHLTHIQIGRD